jgi:p-hydroxybenzoate 3-monooxygenase
VVNVPASAKTTVGIVGAGPAGLVIGHLLRRAGISFVLLERSPRAELGRRPKAGMIEYRTVELLRQEGIAGAVLDFSVPNHRCEFRTPAESAVLDYGALTGGRPHYVYPQHQLVDRLCDSLAAAGGDIRYLHPVERVSERQGEVVLSGTGATGARFGLRCEAAVGCEGSHSPVAAAMTGLRVSERNLPVRWLAVIGAAPPLAQHTIYAAHPRGFAGHMRRGPSHTRYYLEVPATGTLADWPGQRIRAELSQRLGVGGALRQVPFTEPMFVDLRMKVTEPMQRGGLYLAGDAAHLITPAGGKGMNLAIQDAVELAHGLIERFGPARDPSRLAAYSRRRLPAIWRTQAFSNWFLHVLLASLPDGTGAGAGTVPGGFTRGLRDGWVLALQQDPLLARWFAHAYAGVDSPDPATPTV